MSRDPIVTNSEHRQTSKLSGPWKLNSQTVQCHLLGEACPLPNETPSSVLLHVPVLLSSQHRILAEVNAKCTGFRFHHCCCRRCSPRPALVSSSMEMPYILQACVIHNGGSSAPAPGLLSRCRGSTYFPLSQPLHSLSCLYHLDLNPRELRVTQLEALLFLWLPYPLWLHTLVPNQVG